MKTKRGRIHNNLINKLKSPKETQNNAPEIINKGSNKTEINALSESTFFFRIRTLSTKCHTPPGKYFKILDRRNKLIKLAPKSYIGLSNKL